MNKTKKLLAVLDLPEEKQQLEALHGLGYESIIKKEIVAWDKNIQPIEYAYSLRGDKSLADLAFRLRDEAVKKEDGNWCEGSYEVFLHIIGEENEKDEVGLDTWFSMYSRPIHWIVAALIAKSLRNKNG